MFELVRKNRNRSILLVVVMMVVLAGVGWASGELLEPGMGTFGVVIAVVVGVVMFLVSFFSGDSVLLLSAGAREIEKKDAPQLYNIVEEMVIASGLGTMPKVYIIESNVANAFATGRKPEVSAVAVTEGLLNMLSRDELQAVIAHEMAHVKNRDILFMTLLAVMAGAVALIAHVMTRHLFWFGGGRRRSRSSVSGGGQAQLIMFVIAIVLIIVGAVSARLIYFAASRTREYMADAGSAIFTRNPAALASALEKISGSVAGNQLPVPKVAQALLIVGPSLFATHPPIERRVAVLRELAGATAFGYADYAKTFQKVTGDRAKFVPRSALQQSATSASDAEARKQFVARAAAGMAAGAAASKVAGAAGKRPATSLRREALDAVKKRAGYEMVDCSCGGRIKIPANYPRRDKIRCLACGRKLGAT